MLLANLYVYCCTGAIFVFGTCTKTFVKYNKNMHVVALARKMADCVIKMIAKFMFEKWQVFGTNEHIGVATKELSERSAFQPASLLALQSFQSRVGNFAFSKPGSPTKPWYQLRTDSPLLVVASNK